VSRDNRAQPPLLVILGPTAIGKTRLALTIARALDGEIVGADSRQVYRYMDIGTAKPTPAELTALPHHLIDFADPGYNLTLADYQQRAITAIDSIHARGRLPLLVGGTGQYISAVTEGWTVPEIAPNAALRAELEAEAERVGPAAFHARLMTVDPEAAARIHPNNVRRVIRALEVYLETGQPISELQRKQPPPYRILELGLEMERQALVARADVRVDQMMAAGFLDEVAGLLAMGYDRRLPSMSGLGYAQLAAHLIDGRPLADAVQDTKTATHSYIRRQITWFRGHDRGILWHNVEQISGEDLIGVVARWLTEPEVS
jgi:tRNA dimethylallyltransferase